MEIEKHLLYDAIACIRTVIAKKKSRLANFERKLERVKESDESGIGRMYRGKEIRKAYISKLENSLKQFELMV